MLIFFSQQTTPLPDQYTSLFEIQKHTSFVDWQNNITDLSAFVIVSNDADYVAAILESIRRDDKHFASLCFLSESTGESSDQFADGLLPEPEELLKTVEQFVDLETSYRNNETSNSSLDRLIKYLWVRPGFILHPFYAWQHDRYYRYPLLEALSRNELDIFEWLRNLENKKILESVTLVDRQTECKYCNASHLSFIDVCPSCQSKDIKMQSSLHCFTCGHVDVQEKFIQTGSLVCPNCHTQLRHIGSDYDRPIENHRCQTCHHVFTEGDVLGRCAVCRKEMPPSELVSNRIMSWQLGSRGRMIALLGENLDFSASFDSIDFISEEIFTFNLDWFLVMSHRYKNICFSLCGIGFVNLTEMSEVIGYMPVSRVLETFSQRLKGILRNSDLITRTSENMLWLLLPDTDEQGLVSLQHRIEKDLELMIEETDRALDCQFVSMASAQIVEGEKANLLLARLSGQLM